MLMLRQIYLVNKKQIPLNWEAIVGRCFLKTYF
jgi:hypothetical protein